MMKAMMKEEFIEKLQEYSQKTKKSSPGFTEIDYKLIEKVYTFHPSISETEGKRQVAMLFMEFGMRIFRDMEATADKAAALDKEIRTTRLRLGELAEELEELRR